MGINCKKASILPDECFFLRHGKRVYDRSRYQLDYRNPAVRDYADQVIDRLVRDYGVGIPPEKLEAVLRRKLRRTGMLLSEPEVLRAMEHSALESPCYLPIAVKKDGSVSGLAASVLADAAQMGKMGRYVDELLRKVARELGDGNIDADPCRRGPQELSLIHI